MFRVTESGKGQISNVWEAIYLHLNADQSLSLTNLDAKIVSVAIVYNSGPNDITIGPASNQTFFPVPAGTTYKIPFCGQEFNLADWFASSSIANSADVYVLFAQPK